MSDNRKHAMLAPSSALRWRLCPASAKLEYNYADDTLGNPASRTGTLAHRYAELIFRAAMEYNRDSKLKPSIRNMVEQSEEFIFMRRSPDWIDEIPTIIFNNYCQPVWEECVVGDPGGYIGIEEKVSCSPLIEECWGTADFIYITKSSLRVFDLKFGLVPVKDLSQQLLYAFGAYIKYYEAYEPKEIEMRIIQPRLTDDPVFGATISPNKLLSQINDDWVPIGQKANDGTIFYASDVSCKYCKASYKCDAFRKFQMSVSKATADIVLSPNVDVTVKQEWLEYIAGIPSLENYIKIMKSKIAELLRQGAKVPGWILRQRSTREWVYDNAEIINKLKERGASDEHIYEKKLRSVASFETMNIDKKIVTQDLFIWKQSIGSPAYVGSGKPIDLNSLGSGSK